VGYIKHHAIIVTSWDDQEIRRAHDAAVTIFGTGVSTPIPARVNGGASFFVPPDGSKEGWPDSDEGDARRTAFIKWLDRQRYEDGSTSLSWVEIWFGGDDHDGGFERTWWQKAEADNE
jgi:hypothetical protein